MSAETGKRRAGFDWWDVVALVGLVWLSAGLYMLFGAGWAFVSVGTLLIIGGLYGASQEAKASSAGVADARRPSAGQNQAR